MTLHLTATGCHLPYGITQCYLPPDTSESAPPNPSHADWYWFTYPGGMEGWVDLVGLIAPQPGVEPATFRSRVQSRTAAPPRQPCKVCKFCNSSGFLFLPAKEVQNPPRNTRVKWHVFYGTQCKTVLIIRSKCYRVAVIKRDHNIPNCLRRRPSFCGHVMKRISSWMIQKIAMT